jgi:hypothetical protein
MKTVLTSMDKWVVRLVMHLRILKVGHLDHSRLLVMVRMVTNNHMNHYLRSCVIVISNMNQI